MDWITQYFHRLTTHPSKVLFAQLAKLKQQLACCDLCNQDCYTDNLICQTCFDDLPLANLSMLDGDLLNAPEVFNNLSPISFDALICAANHQWPFNFWINQLKYQHRFEVAPLLASFLVHQIRQSTASTMINFDCIVPVPLHIYRYKSRLYNQSQLIAAPLAHVLKIPLDTTLVYRNKTTKKQVGLTGSQRRKNLRHAFTIDDKRLADMPTHVALVDDVITTGSTTNLIATLLKQHGVERVTVLTITIANSNMV